MIKKCENCGAIYSKNNICFHDYDCPHNTLTLKEWKNEDYHRKERMVNHIIEEFKHEEEIKNLSYKELADLIIQELWSKEKFGSRNSVILDRVVNILFDLEDKKSVKNVGSGMG